jgi:hypothetical protein
VKSPSWLCSVLCWLGDERARATRRRILQPRTRAAQYLTQRVVISRGLARNHAFAGLDLVRGGGDGADGGAGGGGRGERGGGAGDGGQQQVQRARLREGDSGARGRGRGADRAEGDGRGVGEDGAGDGQDDVGVSGGERRLVRGQLAGAGGRECGRGAAAHVDGDERAGGGPAGAAAGGQEPEGGASRGKDLARGDCERREVPYRQGEAVAGVAAEPIASPGAHQHCKRLESRRG